jgi:hypothetical protein
MINWDVGRQQSGYLKKLILSSKIPLPFDVYLLKFPTGAEIKTHTDKVESGKHYRLNIILKKSVGGDFICQNPIINFSRIKFFRPDISEHAVTKIISGTRYVLSIGFVLK